MFFDGVEFLTHLSSIRRGIIWKLGDDETKVIEFLKSASGKRQGTGGGEDDLLCSSLESFIQFHICLPH
jgi:hypothetical protein